MHPHGFGGQLGIGPMQPKGVTPGSIFSYFMVSPQKFFTHVYKNLLDSNTAPSWNVFSSLSIVYFTEYKIER